VAAAYYDPDRLAAGLAQAEIAADVAKSACSRELAKAGNSPRLIYQLGRALLAKPDVTGARQQFELAVSEGYWAARVDLAKLLMNSSTRILLDRNRAAPSAALDANRALLLYEQAWQGGVTIAAFELGYRYEHGVHGRIQAGPNYDNAMRGPDVLPIDLSRAWLWYQKGADVGEPNALAHFAERNERDAINQTDPSKRNALLLQAFRFYAAAAERAKNEDWPDDAWRHWRYRRGTLARLLAREGMMQQVADAYQTERDKWTPHERTLWQTFTDL
jgi:hypothetical protein